MKIITLENDIHIFYVPAFSFPDGIMEAHQKLHALVPFSTERKFFGLSRPEDGKIDYKAAAEEITAGEAERLQLETMVIQKGKYISITIHNYMKNIPAIGNAFQKLTAQPDIHPEGYCIEWYISDKDVQCMIKLKG